MTQGARILIVYNIIRLLTSGAQSTFFKLILRYPNVQNEKHKNNWVFPINMMFTMTLFYILLLLYYCYNFNILNLNYKILVFYRLITECRVLI